MNIFSIASKCRGRHQLLVPLHSSKIQSPSLYIAEHIITNASYIRGYVRNTLSKHISNQKPKTEQKPTLISLFNAVTASNPIATTKSEGTQSNRAWVAGPVIGGVAGIVILFFVSWLLFRAKKNKDSKRNGHELHEESALKSELEVKLKPQELEAKPRPQELDAQEHNRQPVELPDNNS